MTWYVSPSLFPIHLGPQSSLQSLRNRAEQLQGRLQVLGDLFGQDIGFREAVRVLQTLVLEPEQIEVELVPLRQLVVGERAPAAVLGISAHVGFRRCRLPGRWQATNSSRSARLRGLVLSVKC